MYSGVTDISRITSLESVDESGGKFMGLKRIFESKF